MSLTLDDDLEEILRNIGGVCNANPVDPRWPVPARDTTVLILKLVFTVQDLRQALKVKEKLEASPKVPRPYEPLSTYAQDLKKFTSVGCAGADENVSAL